MQLNLDLMAINHLDLFAKYVSLTCMDWYRTGIVGLSFIQICDNYNMDIMENNNNNQI